MIKANNPKLRSWIKVPENSDFPIQNIPFGIGRFDTSREAVATRIGDSVIDLGQLASKAYLQIDGIDASLLQSNSLNPLLELNKAHWRALRDRLSELFNENNPELRDSEDARLVVYPLKSVEMLMPVRVGDYTDFYASKEHATNVGTMFRSKENALMPNWLHLPVGYHGRASSIVVSGTEIRRPKGQMRPDPEAAPVFGACRLLDFELEMGCIVGAGKALGERITTEEADDYVFGFVLFNDWSARDIQKWEYVPLGPFLGKSFASSISPWIVTLDALLPFRIPPQEREVPILPYLESKGDKAMDINLEVLLGSDSFEPISISKSNYKNMYWSIDQQVAHHTVNGCNLKAGDMLASGTISGTTPDSYGSMLELTWRGSKPLSMPDGSERKFIQDGDTIILRGYAEKDGLRIGFGEVSGKVLPAH